MRGKQGVLAASNLADYVGQVRNAYETMTLGPGELERAQTSYVYVCYVYVHASKHTNMYMYVHMHTCVFSSLV